jgi:hypothetical protein
MPDSSQRPQRHQSIIPFHVVPRGWWASACGARLAVTVGIAMVVLVWPEVARAGKLSWLDEVVQEVISESRAGAKGLARGGHGARSEIRGSGRLFIRHDADEPLEQLVRRSKALVHGGSRTETVAEGMLETRFSRLLKPDPQAVRTFASLEPAEKQLVVELGETAQQLARRYPQEAETMVRRLGPEGLTAIRVYGDDVGRVLVREGPESLGVLRKAGRGGWAFFTREVLPHKKKLAAAGLLAAFLANPEKFVDSAGRATEFAVREFAKAGVQLASAVGGGAARGIESSINETLGHYGIDSPVLRFVAIGLSAVVVVLSLMVIVGLPVRWVMRPFGWVFRRVAGVSSAR